MTLLFFPVACSRVQLLKSQPERYLVSTYSLLCNILAALVEGDLSIFLQACYSLQCCLVCRGLIVLARTPCMHVVARAHGMALPSLSSS